MCRSSESYEDVPLVVFIIIINHLTARVVGAPQMILQPVFSMFSTALWDLANSRPVHSLMLSSHLFLCLPCLLPPFTVPCKMVLARPDERETGPYHCGLRLFTIVRCFYTLYLLECQVRVTVGDSGFRRCVPCLSSVVNPLRWLSPHTDMDGEGSPTVLSRLGSVAVHGRNTAVKNCLR